MGKFKVTKSRHIHGNINLEEGKEYEIDEKQPIIDNKYKLIVPMKQKGKFRFVAADDEDGVLID